MYITLRQKREKMTVTNRIPTETNSPANKQEWHILWEKMSSFLHLLSGKPAASVLIERIANSIQAEYATKNKPLSAQQKHRLATQELALATKNERQAIAETVAELQQAFLQEQASKVSPALAERVKALQQTTDSTAYLGTAAAILKSFGQQPVASLADMAANAKTTVASPMSKCPQRKTIALS